MKIKAFRLHEHPAILAPAPAARAGAVQSWQLLAPCAVVVRWNGGDRPEDLEVVLEGAADDAPAFAHSAEGHGVLTLEPGYQWRTEGDSQLWLRPPSGPPKTGLELEEAFVDSSRLPAPLAVRWRVTIPGEARRFAAGEPFCTLVLYPKSYCQPVETEVGEIEDALADYEAELQRSLAAPAAQQALQRLRATERPLAVAAPPSGSEAGERRGAPPSRSTASRPPAGRNSSAPRDLRPRRR